MTITLNQFLVKIDTFDVYTFDIHPMMEIIEIIESNGLRIIVKITVPSINILSASRTFRLIRNSGQSNFSLTLSRFRYIQFHFVE